MSIELLGAPRPIYMVGESHSIVYRNLLFRNTRAAQLFLCRTRFMPMVLASSFYATDRRAHNAEVLEALKSEGLLKPDLSAAHGVMDAATVSGSWIERRPIVHPPIVFFGGDMDLHNLLKQMRGHDFELPDNEQYGVNRSLLPVSVRILTGQLEQTFRPLVMGVKHLQTAGFASLMIHALPPRPAQTKEWIPPEQTELRAKLTVLANRVLKRLADEQGIDVIDIWPEASVNGYLRPELDLDGLHLNREAAVMSLQKITDRLFDSTWGQGNLARYNWLAAERASRRDGTDALKPLWDSNGYAAAQLECPELPALSMECQATSMQAEPSAAQLDWVRAPQPAGDDWRQVDLSDTQLVGALKLLEQDDASQILHAGSKVDLTATGCKLLLLSPTCSLGALAWLQEPLPVRKALLCIGGAGEWVLEDRENRAVHRMAAVPGTLVVHDPHRLRCKLTAGQQALGVLDLSLIPRHLGHPFRLIASGFNEWPIDPFQYSVQGMRSMPPVQGDYMLVRAT